MNCPNCNAYVPVHREEPLLRTALNVYIGFDPRQPIAFAVAAASVSRHSSMPVAITQMRLKQLPIQRRGLTEFTYSRFVAPWLSGYKGLSLFIDSDTLTRADINELLVYPVAYPDKDVWIVPHAGKLQFERASVMLLNNAKCEKLTPAFVDDARNSLFDLVWAKDIGELPKSWNHLVGYDDPNPEAKIVHYTKGIPIWKETIGCEFTEEWQKEMRMLGSSVTFDELMGNSVHVTR